METEEEREDREEEERAELRSSRSIMLTPGCCEVMKRTKAIIGICERPDEQPRWYLRLGSTSSCFDIEIVIAEREWDHKAAPFLPTPTHCPFCGATMPTLIKRAYPPSPLAIDDRNGRCGTCKERLGNCACWPPWFAWHTIGDAMRETIAR